jgi:hypothetical protein
MNKDMAEKVLFEGEADEYAAIIKDYPISHDDCIKILKLASKLKSVGYSTEMIMDRLIRRDS